MPATHHQHGGLPVIEAPRRIALVQPVRPLPVALEGRLLARIPRGYDYAAEPEMLFIPRRAAAASAPAKRRARA
jgi:hypothetical protein